MFYLTAKRRRRRSIRGLFQQSFGQDDPGGYTSRSKQFVLSLIVRKPSVRIAFGGNPARAFVAEHMGHLAVYKQGRMCRIQPRCGEIPYSRQTLLSRAILPR